jgi:flagellar biosynthetic protein FliP
MMLQSLEDRPLKRRIGWGLIPMLLLWAPVLVAAPGLPAVTVTQTAGGGETWSLSLQILALMTALTLLPSALLMMTAFTRIIIVLAMLRQALGTMQTPSNQILIGLALFLTFFIMAPVFERINERALAPYLKETTHLPAGAGGSPQPLQAFMLAQTRESDLALFVRLSGRESWNQRIRCRSTCWCPPTSPAS